MKKTFKIIVSFAVLFLLAFFYRSQLQNMLNRLQSQYFPCSAPIAYTIGSFDTRFGISKADFMKALLSAEQIWEKPIGKQLFQYVPNGDLKINLIYDSRQSTTVKLQSMGIIVHNDRASYDDMKATYNSLSVDYTKEKTELQSRIAAFQTAQSSYEAEVAYWNKRGRVTADEYARLNTEKASLDTELSAIQKLQTDFNSKVDDINALVTALNRLASELNIVVGKYNTIGAQNGAEFEEGTYQSGPSGEEIDIYQFDNQTKLIRVLAHELGHALGLSHVDDPKAIMYRLNNGVNEALTSSDVSQLKKLCGIK